MRRSRRKRTVLSVSLFPFLAVLICTFGVLIVLLVITIRAADSQAEAANQEDAESAARLIDDLNAQLDHASVVSEGLLLMRPKLQQRLRDEREKRAHLQNELNKLEREAEKVAERLVLVDQPESPTQNPDEVAVAITELETELSQLEIDLADRQVVQQDGPPVLYNIVPHDSPGGTPRRPIYVECVDDKMILQPYGIELDKQDFAHPVPQKNPLDAALVTIREYFLRNEINASGESPYPLLVVRPSGAESYMLARHAIRGWDDEFGYELISADKPLDFGTADLQLAAEIRKAVSESIQLQRQIAAQNRRRQQAEADTGSRGGLIPSESNGGFVARAGGPDFFPNQSTNSEIRPTGGQNQGGQREWAAESGQINQFNEVGDPTNQRQTGTHPDDSSATAATSVGPQQSLAGKRGSDWALPSKTPGAIGYLRPVRIFCSANELVLESATRTHSRITIPIHGPTEQVVDAMVSEIWKMIERWGVAGANGYWKPELRFTVLPGGQQRYNELQTLLAGSGLKIQQVK